MAKTITPAQWDEFKRDVEGAVRRFIARSSVPLNGVGSLAATTTQFLEQVARELAAPAAPPAPPAPEKKAKPAGAKPLELIPVQPEADDADGDGDAPESRRAICVEIVRAIGREVRVFDVRREAAARGLSLTAKQVSTVLSRAVAAGEIRSRKEGNKNYLYRALDASEVDA